MIIIKKDGTILEFGHIHDVSDYLVGNNLSVSEDGVLSDRENREYFGELKYL